MAASSVRCQMIVQLPNHSLLSVSKQRCNLRLRTKISYQGSWLEDSRATGIRIRRGIQAPSVSTGSVSVLDALTVFNENEYIGYGCLLDDKTFRERFVIRFSEVSTRGKISLETLAALLQEAATNHVLKMEYGFSPGKNMNGNITVTTRMHIEVDKYPEWRDLVEIDTWFQPEGKNSVRRDWIVKNVRTGESMAFATSTWVLMNSQTRRLCKMTEDLWQELEPHMRSPAKWAMSEERRKESSTKIPKLGEEAALRIEGVVASERDCDMNQHVNNVRYLSWMIETVPEEVKRSHEVSKITIEYRQEANQGECVDTVADIEKTEHIDMTHFTHLTKKSSDGKEINRGRTVWRPSQ
ncbi:hypothetical protein Mapa_009728 [Marchantia paleacea]|nr:hypothetical protein Mapa_009728 [Marchantia paleacea]